MADNKVVLITGAAKRIGACMARSFHARGHRVLIHYNHSRDEALALERELNAHRENSADTLRADLTSAIDVDRLGTEAPAVFGRLDCLINNASTFYPTKFGETTAQQWEELIDSNLRAAWFLSQSLNEAIREQAGSIVNIVDTYADRPLAGYPIYSIAKSGLKSMTRSLALELAPGVRVNGVSPGAIIWPASLADDDDPLVGERRAAILGQIPLGSLGDPQDIADMACFLALEADYITGQVIKVDGGRSLA